MDELDLGTSDEEPGKNASAICFNQELEVSNVMAVFEQFEVIYNILILVTFVTLIAWRLKLPSTIAFIVAGILATVSTRLTLPMIGSEIFVTLLLPPILFQEALHINVGEMMKESDSILMFAVLGTVLMQLIVGVFSYYVLGFTLLESLLFGILIAPTDPVAVIRQFHKDSVDPKFRMIISGESLLNDGVSIVIYSILITMLTQGSITLVNGILVSARVILGGIILGVLVGYIVHSIFCWTNDTYAEVLISFITGFGVYQIAEELGVSGVLAIVLSGLIINYRSKKFGGMGPETYNMLDSLWEFIGFLASSIAFIFIGLNLDRGVFAVNFSMSLVIFMVLILLRKIMVELISWIMEALWSKGYSSSWKNGLTWAGLRGAVSIVLALGVSGVVPNSELIIAITFGVVILSNFIQGISMNLLIHDWNLVSDIVTEVHEENIFSETYVSTGYNRNACLGERVLFCAPEFFIVDTRFGYWLSSNLILLINYLNNYSLSSISRRTVGILEGFIKFIIVALIDLVAWVNQYLFRWENPSHKKNPESTGKDDPDNN